MWKTTRIGALVCALLLLSTTAAFAQDRFCSELSDEDCDLYYAPLEASLDVIGGESELDVFFNMTNIPEVPFDEVGFEYYQSSISDGTDAKDLQDELYDMSESELLEKFSDPAEFGTFYGELINGFDLDVEMELVLTPEVAEAISLQAGMEIPESLPLSVILIDGVGYVDAGELSEVGPMMAGAEGWYGADIVPLVEELMTQSLEQQEDNTTPALLARTFSNATGGSGPLVATLSDQAFLGDYEEFFIVERLDGEDGAVFLTTFDIAGFLSSDVFEQLLADQMGAGMGDEELNQIRMGLMLAGPIVANAISLELVEEIDLDTNYMSNSDFELSIDLTDLLSAAAAFGGDIPQLAVDPDVPSVIELSATTSLDYDDDIEITAPEDITFFEIDPETLLAIQ